MRREHVGVVIGLPRVEMDAVVVDDRGEALDHRDVPVAHPVVAAAHELDAGIGALHHESERLGLLDVVLRAQAPDLPAAVHLVAEAPVAYAIWPGMTVLAAEVRPRGVARAVAVLDPGLRLVHGSRAHVDADVRLRAEEAAVLDEFVGAEAIRLLRVPGELAPAWARVHGAHAVEPVIAAHEVAARPAQHGHAQGPHGLQHVLAESALVAERRPFLEDAAVDAAAEVLDEVSEDPPVDLPDLPLEIDLDLGHRRAV